MTLTLTKYFSFSASHEKSGRVWGHNYVLGVTVDAPNEEAEADFVAVVERELVSRMASRDLNLHVDFLKGLPIADRTLLPAFWSVLEKAVAPARLRELTLARDQRTLTVYRP